MITSRGKGAYHRNGREDVDFKETAPLFCISVTDALHRVENAMVDDDSVKTFPGARGELVGFATKTEICEITSQYLDLTRVLLAQVFERTSTSSNDY